MTTKKPMTDEEIIKIAMEEQGYRNVCKKAIQLTRLSEQEKYGKKLGDCASDGYMIGEQAGKSQAEAEFKKRICNLIDWGEGREKDNVIYKKSAFDLNEDWIDEMNKILTPQEASSSEEKSRKKKEKLGIVDGYC